MQRNLHACNIDRDELGNIIAEFNTGNTSYVIQPEELLKITNVPADINAVILAIKPFEHPLLNAGDRSEATVIFISLYIIS